MSWIAVGQMLGLLWTFICILVARASPVLGTIMFFGFYAAVFLLAR